MSYAIYIGERTTIGPGHYNYDEETGERFAVEKISNINAPVFDCDEMTGNTNVRSPAYHVWSKFTKEAGLHDLFFNKVNGLMKDHPGIVSITHEHLAAITEALIKRSTNNSKIPGFSETEDPRYDGTWARLIWLEWWMKYSLQTCKNPSIYNH